jgi:phage terminase small subunit
MKIEVIDKDSEEYRFAQHYVRLGNASEAGRLIGLTDINYIHRLANKPKVIAYINKIKESLRDENVIQKQEWIRELVAIGFSRITDVVEIGGQEITLRRIEDIPEIALPALESITTTPGKYGTSIRVKLHNKMEALRIIGQALAFYEEPEKNVQNFFTQIQQHIKNT